MRPSTRLFLRVPVCLCLWRSCDCASTFDMSWRCSSNSNAGLVNNMKKARLFTDPRVERAMLSVDRADFSPSNAYDDAPRGIGYGATISAPHMHAAALEYLKDHLVKGAYALDIGSGSGYLAVCMADMVGKTGKVVGVEHIPQLVELSINNTRKHHAKMLDEGRLLLVEGDGRLGYKLDRQYDAIHVGAAAEKIPEALIEQLAEGGRMMIPVGPEAGDQVFMQLDKINGTIHKKIIHGVIYVPLTSKSKQLGIRNFLDF